MQAADAAQLQDAAAVLKMGGMQHQQTWQISQLQEFPLACLAEHAEPAVHAVLCLLQTFDYVL